MNRIVRVERWGRGLAVRLPADLVNALGLKAGDEVEVEVNKPQSMERLDRAARKKLIARLRKYQGRIPADFKFDRDEANER